jgi:hypothetical protein
MKSYHVAHATWRFSWCGTRPLHISSGPRISRTNAYGGSHPVICHKKVLPRIRQIARAAVLDFEHPREFLFVIGRELGPALPNLPQIILAPLKLRGPDVLANCWKRDHRGYEQNPNGHQQVDPGEGKPGNGSALRPPVFKPRAEENSSPQWNQAPVSLLLFIALVHVTSIPRFAGSIRPWDGLAKTKRQKRGIQPSFPVNRQGHSADFQSASLRKHSTARVSMRCGLETRDTADWKSALPRERVDAEGESMSLSRA